MNFLEQLAAEWYEYSGYFVRTNIHARKRQAGGWDVELDVLAYSPSKQEVLHIETSGDAVSWGERKRRFLEKKFILSKQDYQEILGAEFQRLKRIAVVGQTKSTRADIDWGGDIEVILIPNFLREIATALRKRDIMNEAVPESYPILRSIQMILSYGLGTA
jgi:hypothetical protein